MINLGLNALPWPLLAGLLLTAFASGLGRGFSGFGSALIFMPLASAMIGAKLASPLMLIIEIIAAIGLVPGAARIANKRDVALMAVGSLVGAPLGAWFLLYADPLTVRWLIVALIVPLLGLMMAGWRYTGRTTPPLTIGGMKWVRSSVAWIFTSPIRATSLVCCVVNTGIAKPTSPISSRIAPPSISPVIGRPIEFVSIDCVARAPGPWPRRSAR